VAVEGLVGRASRDMTCEDLTQRLPELWAGELPADERLELEAHLASCPACREEAQALGDLWRALGEVADVEPEATVAASIAGARVADAGVVDPRIAEARVLRHAPRASWVRRASPVWQMAAALLVAAAGFAAGRSWPNVAPETAIAEMRGELHGMRQMVALSLLRQESASERLRGVTWSANIDRPGAEVIGALVDTLQHDGNVNVRLAAIDALRQYGAEAQVREALVRALPVDPSPLVQIALIDAVVALRERRSADALRALSSGAETNQVVRQRARRGLEQLL
jgi:hypothetical protein